MTSVEVTASLRYGFTLFVYLLAVVVLGGGGLVLGGALAVPEVVDSGVVDSLGEPAFIGGIVLATLGLTVSVTGLYGLTYKLIADAVWWGVTNGTPEAVGDESAETARAGGAAEATKRERTEVSFDRLGPSPGEQTARRHGSTVTVPSAASVPDRGTNERRQRAEDQPTTAVQSTGETEASREQPAVEQKRSDAAARGDDSGAEAAGDIERTAEEIAFGSESAESTEAVSDESSTRESTDNADAWRPPTASDDSTENESERDDGSATERESTAADVSEEPGSGDLLDGSATDEVADGEPTGSDTDKQADNADPLFDPTEER